MYSTILLYVSGTTFIAALAIIAFIFYYIGKNKTVSVSLIQLAGLLLLTVITTAGDPIPNPVQTIATVAFSYFATATVSYVLGYTERPIQAKK